MTTLYEVVLSTGDAHDVRNGDGEEFHPTNGVSALPGDKFTPPSGADV